MEARTTVCESGDLGVVAPAHGFDGPPDQRGDVGIGSGNRPEHLSCSASGLDVADADLKVAFALFAAAYEGRIQGDSDCRGGVWRLIHRRTAELLADEQRMAPQMSQGSSRRRSAADIAVPQSVRTAGLAVGSTQGLTGGAMVQLPPVSPEPQPAHRNRGSRSLTSPNSVAIRCGRQSFTWHLPPHD